MKWAVIALKAPLDDLSVPHVLNAPHLVLAQFLEEDALEVV